MALKTVVMPRVVKGRLPRTLPIIEATHRRRREARPPRNINSPVKMKNGTASSANLSMLENMIWCVIAVGTFRKKTSTAADVAKRIRKMGNPRHRRTTGASTITQLIAGGDQSNLPLT